MKNQKRISHFRKNVTLLFVLGLAIFLCTSCSRTRLSNLMARSVKIDYTKPNDYRNFNKYEKDALYMVEVIRQSYPRLSTKIADYDFVSAEFMKQATLVKDDYEFDITLRKFIALLKDGHSGNLIEIKDKNCFNLLLFKDHDQWLVKTIDRSLDSMLIGATLLSINGKPIKHVHSLLNTIECGENDFWNQKSFGNYIRIPKYLEAAGIIDEGADLELVLLKEGKEESLSLERKPLVEMYKVEREKPIYAFTKKQNNGFFTKVDSANNYAYLQMNTSLDYTSIKAEIDNYVNPLIKPIVLKLLRKEKEDAMNFGLVLQTLFQQVEEDSIENLIIDLRKNLGGDERLGKQLIWYLTENTAIKGFTQYGHNSLYYRKSMKKDYQIFNDIYKRKYQKNMPEGEINETEEFYNEPYFYGIENPNSPYLLDSSISKFKGKIYVLIGEETFSAGQVLATTLYDNGIGTFVGTPTGNQPTTQTCFSMTKLPKTKRIVSLSIGYMERPDTTKNAEKALYPHVAVYPSFEKGYLGNMDEAFDYIMKDCAKNNASESVVER